MQSIREDEEHEGTNEQQNESDLKLPTVNENLEGKYLVQICFYLFSLNNTDSKKTKKKEKKRNCSPRTYLSQNAKKKKKKIKNKTDENYSIC